MAEEGQVIPIHANDVEKFESIVKKEKDSGKLIVVDFTASWCPPCRFIAPIFVELAKKHIDVIFLKVDVDEVKPISEKFEVTAMPTFVFLQREKEVHRIVGADKVELGKRVLEFSTVAAASTA